MKVTIKDFQIVKSASLEFIPGLTVINGESNNGKSALFRAVKSCIYNEPGTTNVRMGCKNYIVGIEHNNHKVIMQKGENSLYLIDGKQYNKIGKTQLPEVARILGITALNINDTTEKINFWDQMEKPFLLDRNAYDLFRFIVDTGEDDNLNTTLRSMVTDKNNLNTEKNLKEGSINVLKNQIQEMETALAFFEDKIQLCENIISYGPITANLLTTKKTIEETKATKTVIEEVTKALEEGRQVSVSINNSMDRISYLISKKNQLSDLINKYATTAQLITQYGSVTNKKVDFKDVTKKIDKYINEYTTLATLLKNINKTKDLIAGIKVDHITCSITQEEINKLNILNSLLTRIDKVNNTIVQVKSDIDTLHKEYDPILTEYNGIKICPYCGNKLHGKEAA